MNHYSFLEIIELAKTEPRKELRLHWEGDPAGAKKTNPIQLIDAEKEGEFTSEQFEKIGYCVSEEDYQKEQAEYLSNTWIGQLK